MSSTSSYSSDKDEIDILAEEMKSLKLKRGRPPMSGVEKAKRDIQRLEGKPYLQKFMRPSQRRKIEDDQPQPQHDESEREIIKKPIKQYTRKSQVYKPEESKDVYFRSKTPKKSQLIYYSKSKKNTPSPVEMKELKEGKNKFGRKKTATGGRRTRKIRKNKTKSGRRY
jgi:hypothetical protein